MNKFKKLAAYICSFLCSLVLISTLCSVFGIGSFAFSSKDYTVAVIVFFGLLLLTGYLSEKIDDAKVADVNKQNYFKISKSYSEEILRQRKKTLDTYHDLKGNTEELEKIKEHADIKIKQKQKERTIREEKEKLEKSEKFRQLEILKLMKKSLPFYCKAEKMEGDFGVADNLRWASLNCAIEQMNKTPTTLYLVRLRSLLDNNEYFKIGVTTKTIEERFDKSTQLELLEIIEQFPTFKYIALFAEYHFIREFGYTPELVASLKLTRPKVKFFGASEIVRPNSVEKISGFFSKLHEYEAKILSAADKELKG